MSDDFRKPEGPVQTSSGYTIAFGEIDASKGAFIDWNAEFMQKGLAAPAAASEAGDPSEFMGQPTGVGYHPTRVIDVPGRVVGEPQAAPQGAALPAGPVPQAPPPQAPQGPVGGVDARNPMPFANVLAPMLAKSGHTQPPGPPFGENPPPMAGKAGPAPEDVPPAAKMADSWIDWDSLGRMAGSYAGAEHAENTGGRGTGGTYTYPADEEEDDGDEPMERSMGRADAFDVLMKGVLGIAREETPVPFGSDALEKAARKPPGGGWGPIPGGKHGGMRRRRGKDWEYWYPDGAQGMRARRQQRREAIRARRPEAKAPVTGGTSVPLSQAVENSMGRKLTRAETRAVYEASTVVARAAESGRLGRARLSDIAADVLRRSPDVSDGSAEDAENVQRLAEAVGEYVHANQQPPKQATGPTEPSRMEAMLHDRFDDRMERISKFARASGRPVDLIKIADAARKATAGRRFDLDAAMKVMQEATAWAIGTNTTLASGSGIDKKTEENVAYAIRDLIQNVQDIAEQQYDDGVYNPKGGPPGKPSRTVERMLTEAKGALAQVATRLRGEDKVTAEERKKPWKRTPEDTKTLAAQKAEQLKAPAPAGVSEDAASVFDELRRVVSGIGPMGPNLSATGPGQVADRAKRYLANNTVTGKRKDKITKDAPALAEAMRSMADTLEGAVNRGGHLVTPKTFRDLAKKFDRIAEKAEAHSGRGPGRPKKEGSAASSEKLRRRAKQDRARFAAGLGPLEPSIVNEARIAASEAKANEIRLTIDTPKTALTKWQRVKRDALQKLEDQRDVTDPGFYTDPKQRAAARKHVAEMVTALIKMGDNMERMGNVIPVHGTAQELRDRKQLLGAAEEIAREVSKYEKIVRGWSKAQKSHRSMPLTSYDAFGRPLSKGWYDFMHPEESAASLPEDMLYDYLVAAVEQAYEHESRERQHGGLDTVHRKLDEMARAVMLSLVQAAPNNANLRRAMAACPCDKASIAQMLTAHGIYRGGHDGGWTSDQDSFDVMAGIKGATFALSHNPDAIRPIAAHRPPDNVAHLVKSDNVDPYAAIAARQLSHEARMRAALHPDTVTRGPNVSADCPVHNGRDLTKSMNLYNPMTPCTCHGTPRAYG